MLRNITLNLNDKVLTPNGKSITVDSGTLTVGGSKEDQASFVTGVCSSSSGIDGTYSPRVVQIGDNYYASLASAVAVAEENSEVKLLSDITLAESVTVSKSITLDLNSKAVTKSGDSYVYVNAGALTLKNPATNQSEFVFGVKGENGTYTACVAQIGNNTYFATLEAAIDAAEDGDTVVLLQDTSLTIPKVIWKNLIIDLNKHIVSFVNPNNEKGAAIKVGINNEDIRNNSTITDVPKYKLEIRDGKINADRGKNAGTVFAIYGGSTLYLEGVTVDDKTTSIPESVSYSTISVEAYYDLDKNVGCSSNVIVKNSTLTNEYGKMVIDGYSGQSDGKPVVIEIENSKIEAKAEFSDGIHAIGHATITVKDSTIIGGLRGLYAHPVGTFSTGFTCKGEQTVNIENSTIKATTKDATPYKEFGSSYALLVYAVGDSTVTLNDVELEKADTTEDGDPTCIVAFAAIYMPDKWAMPVDSSSIKVYGNSADAEKVALWKANAGGTVTYCSETE